MAYITTEEVKEIRENIKKAFPRKEGWKFSIKRVDGMQINVAILEAPINLDPENKGEVHVNHFWIERNYEAYPEVRDVLVNLMSIMTDSKERSDSNAGDMGADYPNWNYFIGLSIGNYDKPFKFVTV